MSNLSNIRIMMDKTRHRVPKFLTTNLIKHKSIKGTKVVKRESLEAFNYRRAFYTTGVIILLSVGIGYGIFTAMNIGLTKEEVKANLLNEFNNSDHVVDTLDRKGVDSLTYIFDKDLDNNKVYTFTDTSDKKLEHDVTSNVYHVKDIAPANVPTTVKRAYSKEDIETNYIKSVDGVELNDLETGRERDSNTYILKKEFNDEAVYAFNGLEIEAQQHPVTSSVYYVEGNIPKFVPSNIKRAYSKEDIENNYVRKLDGSMLQDIVTKTEVDPNTYILKSDLDSNSIYTIKGKGIDKTLVDVTTSILYKSNDEDVRLPTNISTRGYTKKVLENTYIRPDEVKDLQGLTTNTASDPRLYTWDYDFNQNTAYAFNGSIIEKKSHIVTDSLYYVTDKQDDLIPTNVRRAYSRKDVEANYALKSGESNLNDLNISYERNELNNKHVYSFNDGGINKAKNINQITTNVHYVGEIIPVNVPSLVTRAYTVKEVEDNYVLKMDSTNIGNISSTKEVDPNTYIVKNTLETGIYYQSQGKDNDLSVNQLSIQKNDLFVTVPVSNRDSTLMLEKIDSEDRKYVDSDIKEEGVYVVDNNSDSRVSKLTPIEHKESETYDIIDKGGETNISLTREEILTLDNKIKLFKADQLDTFFDRYGWSNWWPSYGNWAGYPKKWLDYGWRDHSFIYFIWFANKSLPRGAWLTAKEIEHINNNHVKYNFRLWLGNTSADYNLSYGILQNPDGTEWTGFKKMVQEEDHTTTTIFPPGAKTSADQYKWKMSYSRHTQKFSLWVDATKSTYPNIRNMSVSFRGIQIYINPDYVEDKTEA